ncbi:hypothetical protein Lalb_Chr11g0074921 [Lupinus albus]|uniref:Knottin, scorpion toxin n=1 Tax=Lupinus albus TaxID=3870 RepID=A0A6A4PTW5_LUPAL|nr:hypothetical protein Lalb_Chr11g0074921 [Lupinus albus]
MANRALNYYHLFVMVVLLVTGGSMKLAAAQEYLCTEYLGACGPAGQCDRNCKAKHSDGSGSCDFNLLCTCVYIKGCKPHVKNAAVKFMAITKQK